MPENLVSRSKPRQYPPASQLWQIPGIIAAIGLFVLAGYVAKKPPEEPQSETADFAALVQAYEGGDIIVSASSAERFLMRYTHPAPQELSVARFVLADSKWDLTKSNPATTSKDLADCLIAFERARLAGLKPDYEAKALSAKADILLRLGQTTEALEAYTQLLDEFPQRRDVLLSMALAYAGSRPPLMDKASECVDKYLASEGLAPQEIQEGYLTKADIALRRKDYATAAAAAKQVVDAKAEGETAGRATLLLARALIGQEDYSGAIAAVDALGSGTAGRYEAGLCLARATAVWKSGDIDGARKAFDDTIFKFPATHEALSAKYELAKLLFEKGDIAAAKDTLASLLDDMSSQQAISTEYFGIDEVTELWFAVGRTILEQNPSEVHSFHSAAIQFMPTGHFLFFDANLYRQEAEQLEADLPGLPATRGAAAGNAKNAYLEAGKTFAKVLETSSGELYQEALRNAGYCFYRAGDYVTALHYLKGLTDGGFRDERLPEIVYEQARCLAAMGNYAPAIQVARRNAEQNPSDIYAYYSILLQADLYRGMGGDNLRYAADIYANVLTDDRFEATSSEWRRSIFALGETLYRLGNYREAVLKLDEALTRFPSDPEAPNAQYDLALACRQAAFADPSMKQTFFLKAAKIFNQIVASASGRDDARARTAAFLEADCYYDLGDYQKALSLYDKAVEANVDTPEATRALFQIATCYHRLGMKDQANATYKRAVFNLKRRPEAPAPGAGFYESLSSWLGTEENQG